MIQSLATLINECGQSRELTATRDFMCRMFTVLDQYDTSTLDPTTAHDVTAAADAIRRAINGDYTGTAEQYYRMVNADLTSPDAYRMFFTVWRRTFEDPPKPFLALCTINRRNLELLNVTRSSAFVRMIANRLGFNSYPPEILASRVQGIDTLACAGQCPQVLFADFVEMGRTVPEAATAGGLLFDEFGDTFLADQMPLVTQAFPNAAGWLKHNGILNSRAIHLLTAAHVQAHDLCGHSIPYNLMDETRRNADPFLRSPLEECYADLQAMWIYSSSNTRKLLSTVLSDIEMDAVPILIAMKRLTYYATLSPEDHDARCSWMMFRYWCEFGLISERGDGSLMLNLDKMQVVADRMLSDLLQVELAIGRGVNAYEDACKSFSLLYGGAATRVGDWKMPPVLEAALGGYHAPCPSAVGL